MQIKRGTAHGVHPYFTVHVDENELRCDGGKFLPYPTTIGTISFAKGRQKINVWTPAASTPRGYKSAAKRALESAAERLSREAASEKKTAAELDREIQEVLRGQ